MPQFIQVTRRDAILEIVLDRPPANAITPLVGAELHSAFSDYRDDPELRACILTGAGERIFCAGWDMKAVADFDDPTDANDATMNQPGGFAGFTEMWDIKKPIIAAVNGFAVGGGFEMALAADIIVAAEHASFILPEMQRGFVPDAGAVQRLPRKLPYNVAVELMLTGRTLDAHEATRLGLVNYMVTKENLMPKAREIATILSEGAPLAVRALLEILPAIDRLSLPAAFDKLRQERSKFPLYEQSMNSEDFLEGPRAYAEKRKPVWRGR